jgi:hypothetical protein
MCAQMVLGARAPSCLAISRLVRSAARNRTTSSHVACGYLVRVVQWLRSAR